MSERVREGRSAGLSAEGTKVVFRARLFRSVSWKMDFITSLRAGAFDVWFIQEEMTTLLSMKQSNLELAIERLRLSRASNKAFASLTAIGRERVFSSQ